MKTLEEEVGCLLLDRVGKKVLLTQAGEQLLHHAEKILIEMDAARRSLEYLGKWGSVRLRIGASLSVCEYILPPLLRKLMEQFPQCLVNIEPVDTPEAMDRLYQQQIDLALVLSPDENAQCEFEPMFTDELVFLVNPNHPWVKNGLVIREQIATQNYILYSRNSYTFRVVEEYFRRENMVLKTVMQVGSMEASKELVKLGLGVAVLAPWIAQKELAENSLVALPLGRRKLKRTWGLAHRRGRRLNLVEETFLGLCRSQMPIYDAEAEKS